MKKYKTIGEVAKEVSVKTHTLRFWEKKFKQIKPKILFGERRYYSHNDVKLIILSSTGPVFCAGHNLKDLNYKRKENDNGKSYYEKIFGKCSNKCWFLYVMLQMKDTILIFYAFQIWEEDIENRS